MRARAARIGLVVACCLALFALGLWLRLDHEDSLAQQAAPVEITSITGEPADLAALARSSSPLLVNFWATWCPPCRHELPLLDDAASSSEAQFAVIAVAIDEHEPAAEYWQENGFGFKTYISGLQAGPRLMKAYGNETLAMPYSVLLGGDGTVLAAKIGPFADVAEIIRFGNK